MSTVIVTDNNIRSHHLKGSRRRSTSWLATPCMTAKEIWRWTQAWAFHLAMRVWMWYRRQMRSLTAGQGAPGGPKEPRIKKTKGMKLKRWLAHVWVSTVITCYTEILGAGNPHICSLLSENAEEHNNAVNCGGETEHREFPLILKLQPTRVTSTSGWHTINV